ncbi:HU family DNA-binding protein [Methylobacter marinus]|uniref:HU family DNA-binding protein n=1 Tax=Methylobacter marinus TaxID=34058 RepID=UPI0003760204|nr:HU family DNA-binding protein [Methylobacter marinus]
MTHKELIEQLSKTAQGESKASMDRIATRTIYLINQELKSTGKVKLPGISKALVVESENIKQEQSA